MEGETLSSRTRANVSEPPVGLGECPQIAGRTFLRAHEPPRVAAPTAVSALSGKLTPLGTPRANWGGRSTLEDILDCLYVMLAHVEDPDDMQRITALVDGSDCIPLKNQLARLLPEGRSQRLDPSEMHRRPVGRVVFRMLGVPEDALLLTHRDDVRSISPDEQWIGTSVSLADVRPREVQKAGLGVWFGRSGPPHGGA